MKYIGQNVKSVGLKASKECEKALYSAFWLSLKAKPRDEDVVLNHYRRI